MEADSGNSTLQDELNPFPAKLCLSFCLPLTLTCSALFAVAIYKKVDVGHPVFAVVLQEIVALCAVQFLSIATLLPMMAELYRIWAVLFGFLCMLALEIHQLSWMTITLLRYYFLVHLRSDDSPSSVPPSRLRRLSLSLVWALLPPHLLLSFAATVPMLRARGWHQRNSILHMPSSDRLTILFSAQAVVNLPDLVSIAVYLVTWNSLRKKNRQIHIHQQQEQEEHVQEGPIFVIGGGGDADSVSSSSTVATSREKEDGEQEESEQDNEEAAVMRTLRNHVALSLLDTMFPLVTLLPLPWAYMHLLWMVSYVVYCFWLPLLVIGKGFKKMGEMLKHYVDIIC